MIIDDHPIIHDGLKTLFAGSANLTLTEGAFSSTEAEEKLETSMPDLAIIDLSLGDSDGTYLIQRLRAKYPQLKMLIYSMSEERLFAERAANAGADGYVMKTAGSDILREAVHQILDGNVFFSTSVLKRIQKKRDGNSAGYDTMVDILSNREMDVFKLIGQGLDAVTISDKLNISRNTVDTHRINIKNKLDLANGKALDRLAYEIIQQGLMPEQQKRQAGR